MLALIVFVVTVHWFDRAGLRDNVDGNISFIDVLYFTAITVTTVGYGDITPVSDEARLFDAFVVTPVRIFIWLIFLGSAYQFLFKRVWEQWRMQKIQQGLGNHVVLAGYGRTGTEVGRELQRRGTAIDDILVVDLDPAAIEDARAADFTVLLGDATRNAVLDAVHIARASTLIVAASADDTSILIVLTARRLAPALPISVVIRNEDNEALATQAGATTVINPIALSGLLLAGSSEGPCVAKTLLDLANASGQIELSERPVTTDEVGKCLDAITTGRGVRIYRNDVAYCFSSPAAQALQPGDTIVEVVPQGPLTSGQIVSAA